MKIVIGFAIGFVCAAATLQFGSDNGYESGRFRGMEDTLEYVHHHCAAHEVQLEGSIDPQN